MMNQFRFLMINIKLKNDNGLINKLCFLDDQWFVDVNHGQLNRFVITNHDTVMNNGLLI